MYAYNSGTSVRLRLRQLIAFHSGQNTFGAGEAGEVLPYCIYASAYTQILQGVCRLQQSYFASHEAETMQVMSQFRFQWF